MKKDFILIFFFLKLDFFIKIKKWNFFGIKLKLFIILEREIEK
jgi:hypothetical protein